VEDAMAQLRQAQTEKEALQTTLHNSYVWQFEETKQR